MTRAFSDARFDEVFRAYISQAPFQEAPGYYDRYRARYHDVLQWYSTMANAPPETVLDIGGGQLALLCHKLWGDRAEAADIGGGHLDYLRDCGVHAYVWNLLDDDQPVTEHYDTVFFSEVIEHLPIPGHLALEKLRTALKPQGLLICTTPNLYRPRNVVFMALGRPIFDHFRIPREGGLGHVLEYSAEHLHWQLDEAGFEDVEVRFHQVEHVPNRPVHRVLYTLGRPLYAFRRMRDNLFATARRPRT